MFQSIALGTNSSEIKLRNLSAILLNLLYHDQISRVALAHSIGVSTATVSNLVAELVELGLIVEEGLIHPDGQPNVGRPQRALKLVPNSRYAVGIHIDVGRVHITITDLIGTILQHSTFEHEINTPWDQVMDQIVEVALGVIAEMGINRPDIVGAGVAASGLIDHTTGVNTIAPNLNWHNVPIRDYLHSKLEMPIAVENNVRAMALGEALLGLLSNHTAMAFIYARIGVGAGLVMNGKLYRGDGSGAGEIGHTLLAVIDKDGERALQSLESLVSVPAILGRAEQIAEDNPDGELARTINSKGLSIQTVFEAGLAEDIPTLHMLEECAFYVGIAITNLINIFNPKLIVLGGIFSQEHDLMLPTIKQTVEQYSIVNPNENVQLRVTQFGANAGMIGAAALALDQFFYRPQFADRQLSRIRVSF